MCSEIEPLYAELWFARLRMIAIGEISGIENSLRHAAHLTQLAPPPFRARIRLAITEADYESLLAAGQFDGAARHLVGRSEVLSVEERQDGCLRLVTVSCIVLDHPVVGRGASLAHAILDAWTKGLLAFEPAPDRKMIQAGMWTHAENGALVSKALVSHQHATDRDHTV